MRSSMAESTAVCQPPPERPVHGHAPGVCMFVRQEDVQAAFHGQVHRAHAGNTAQVDVCLLHVKGRALQFTHADKFGVERKHAPFGEVDAAGLLIVHGLATPMVTVRVQDGGDFVLEVGGLIQKCGDVHARIAFIAELPDTVASARFDHAAPLDNGWGAVDAWGVAEQVDFFQKVFADFCGPLLPFGRRSRGFEPGEFLPVIVHHDAGVPLAEEFAREGVSDLSG